MNFQKHQIIDLAFAAALLAAFFMPWAKVFMISGSGFDIAKQFGGEANFLWAIPAVTVAIGVMTLMGKSTKLLSVVSGVLPFAILLRVLIKAGKNTTDIMAVGGYLTVLIGAFILFYHYWTSGDPKDHA